MITTHGDYDIIVAGAGIGGVSAALASARAGCRVALLEAAGEIGGTGVHSPVGLVCTWFDSAKRPINRGLNQEFMPYLYEPGALSQGVIQTYHEAELKAVYQRLLEGEPSLDVVTNCRVVAVEREEGEVRSVRTSQGQKLRARVFIDSTADGNLAALAGAEYQKGRVSDGLLQPSTLTFRVEDVDFTAFGMEPDQPGWARWDNLYLIEDALLPYYRELIDSGGTSNPRRNILCFPDRGGKSLLFNQTRIPHADPTVPGSVDAAMQEGKKQIGEFWSAVGAHPAFARASIVISEKLGVREGRRIVGDYVLTAEDCLREARFPDMVAACGYALDIHDPAGTSGTSIREIPGSGYYHIPYRCLIARDFRNLLLGSRCISGTHEAHSSYRVMPPVSAIGQGTAAALFMRLPYRDVREISSAWIRDSLRDADQFVEGTCAPAPSGPPPEST